MCIQIYNNYNNNNNKSNNNKNNNNNNKNVFFGVHTLIVITRGYTCHAIRLVIAYS